MILLTGGLWPAFVNQRSGLHIWRHHIKEMGEARQLMADASDKLHPGCGPDHKAGWLYFELSGSADLKPEMREPLPFPANSFSITFDDNFRIASQSSIRHGVLH